MLIPRREPSDGRSRSTNLQKRAVDSHSDNDDYDVGETDNPGAILQAAAEQMARATKAARRAPRRSYPRLGPDLLLGPKGFAELLRLVAREMERWPAQFQSSNLNNGGALTVNPIGKLDGLMRVYREWVHWMYPKFQFRDTVDKIERQCRTPPLKVYLRALQRATQEGVAFDEVQFNADQHAAHAMAAINQDISEPPIEESPQTDLPINHQQQ